MLITSQNPAIFLPFLLFTSLFLVGNGAQAQNVETPNFITFTSPPRYNGSTRANFTAGGSMNISWTSGGNGQPGTLALRLTGGEENVTIAPDIAWGIHRINNSYNWKIPTILPIYPFYDIKIVLESNDTIFAQAKSFFTIDISRQSVSSSSSSISSTPTPSTTSTTSSGTPTPTSTPSSASSLSTGAKAGIGAGAAVGGLGLMALLAFLFFRQGKKAAAKRPHEMIGDTEHKEPEIDSPPRGWSELHSEGTVELSAHPSAYEMAGSPTEEHEARMRNGTNEVKA